MARVGIGSSVAAAAGGPRVEPGIDTPCAAGRRIGERRRRAPRRRESSRPGARSPCWSNDYRASWAPARLTNGGSDRGDGHAARAPLPRKHIRSPGRTACPSPVSPPAAAPLLVVEGLSVRFGGVVALDEVSFAVAGGQICGLIGPNGAGKTTLFNCLSRLYQADRGAIRFEGGGCSRPPSTRSRRSASAAPFRIWRCSAPCRCGKISWSAVIAGHPAGFSPMRCACRSRPRGAAHSRAGDGLIESSRSAPSPERWSAICLSAPRSASSWPARWRRAQAAAARRAGRRPQSRGG